MLTPIDAEVNTSNASMWNGCFSASSSALTMLRACCSSAKGSISSTNSSPLMRASMSVSRSVLRMRSATFTSKASPTRWL